MIFETKVMFVIVALLAVIFAVHHFVTKQLQSPQEIDEYVSKTLKRSLFVTTLSCIILVIYAIENH